MRFAIVLAFCIALTQSVMAAKKPEAKGAAGGKPSAAVLDKGKQLFNMNCATCHGEKGDGTGPAAAALVAAKTPPRNFTKDPFKQGDTVDAIAKTISTGIPGTPMVAYGHLSEEDRKALAYWIINLKGKK